MDKLSVEPTTDTELPGRPVATVVVRRKTLVISTLVALGSVGVAYGVGRLQGTVEVRRVEAKAATDVKQEGEETNKLRTELASTRMKLLRLEARRELHKALLALDQRNFGIAQQHVELSGKLLDSSHPSDGELARLAKAIAGKKLIATEDLAAQRRELLAWANRFDELVAPIPP